MIINKKSAIVSPFQEKLLSNFQHQMNADQTACAQTLEEFLRNPLPYCCLIIKGYAGTGKTTLLGATVKTLAAFKVKTTLLAPTGKAAKVLSGHSSKSAFTIHKHIYRSKNKTDQISQLQLAPNLSPNTVFIVDEASMIGDYTMNNDGLVNGRNLLSDLIEFVYSGKGCKLILLGDTAQLPPVGTDQSPALNRDYLSNYYPELNLYEASLSEVVRQELDSSILANATQIRSHLEETPKVNPTLGPDLIAIEGGELEDLLDSSFSNYGTEDTIVITRSNKRCNQYNQHIRARIFWFEELICGNDSLMIVKNNYHWLKDEPQMGFIANGEVVKIKRVLKYETLYGFEFARVRVQFPDYPDIDEKEVIIHLETLMNESPNLSRNRQKELFYAIEEDYLHEKNKKKRYELILEDPYFNALQVKFAYAVTCHKSQGGQWEHVYIDLGYLPEDVNYYELNRWLYTAITRAKSTVYLINFPKEFLDL